MTWSGTFVYVKLGAPGAVGAVAEKLIVGPALGVHVKAGAVLRAPSVTVDTVEALASTYEIFGGLGGEGATVPGTKSLGGSVHAITGAVYVGAVGSDAIVTVVIVPAEASSDAMLGVVGEVGTETSPL